MRTCPVPSSVLVLVSTRRSLTLHNHTTVLNSAPQEIVSVSPTVETDLNTTVTFLDRYIRQKKQTNKQKTQTTYAPRYSIRAIHIKKKMYIHEYAWTFTESHNRVSVIKRSVWSSEWKFTKDTTFHPTQHDSVQRKECESLKIDTCKAVHVQ